MSVSIPPSKKGWMKKQGRKGLVKNWKKRYFVLEAGKLMYYVDKLDIPPFGDVLKGELSLMNTEIVEEYKKTNECQIYIVSYNGENNMLMETENLSECQSWISSLKAHCQYADYAAENGVASFKRKSATFTPSEVNRGSAAEEKEPTRVPDARRSSSPVPPEESFSAPTSSPKTAPVAEARKTHGPSSSSAAGAASTSASSSNNNEDSSSSSDAMINPTDFGGMIVDSIQNAMSTLQQKESRDAFLSSLVSNTQTTLSSLLKNLQEGEMGKRGEEWFVALFALSFLILVGMRPLMFRLISFLMKLSSFVYVLAGLFLIVNGLWELKANVSPFITPVRDNTLVTGGVYRFCRHPMYGGLILLCVGRSIATKSMEKLLLSIILALVLDQVSQLEESLLAKTHPKKYKEYASTKKKLIPLLY